MSEVVNVSKIVSKAYPPCINQLACLDNICTCRLYDLGELSWL